jgi:hypothetical protein
MIHVKQASPGETRNPGEPELAEAIRNIPMPSRLKSLPISDKGFPIPAFVAWMNQDRTSSLPPGTFGAIRDFRVIDPAYMDRCFRFSRCWICGEPLGRHRIFAVEPMCTVSRTTMEPPSHRDCVEYSARVCPFIMRPRMRRNDKELPEGVGAPGILIERNPGVFCLWETESYVRFRAPGGMLCKLGEPAQVDWRTEGRPATRAEVVVSIDSGMPFLMDLAVKDGPDAVAQLKRQREDVERFLPDA